jgi:acyl-CoA dehydrogenase
MSDASLTDALADQVERLLEDGCTRQIVETAEQGAWPAELWRQLEDMGLPAAAASESRGGHGIAWEDLSGVLHALGRYAAPVPLAETMVATWLLGRAGSLIPSGPVVLSPTAVRLAPDGRLVGRAMVAWPSQGDFVVALAKAREGTRICLVRAPDLRPSGPRGLLVLDSLAPEHISEPQDDLTLDPALPALAVARATQIAGAINRLMALSVTYANDRRQFGQPIGKFQAVQHMLAEIAMEAAAATTASEFGLRQLETHPILGAGIAKARASRAAGAAAAFAHQIHGAIGVTAEHELHHYTRALWRWRDDAGSEHDWAERLGEEALVDPPGSLWSSLIARLDGKM